MTAQKYYKRGVVKAERFDGSAEMAERYNLFNVYEDADGIWMQIETLEGWLDIKQGDWIATGANGEHWPIADDIFRKTYQPLPVVPKAVGDWGARYQILTGHDLIVGLADDAMQEEPLGKSYTGVEGIALDKRYRAYLDAGGSSLSGDWEVDAKGIEYLMLESELKPVAMPASTKGDADV